MQRCVKTADCD